MNLNWAQDAFFYHIYPLAACGAPARNDFSAAPLDRLSRVGEWIPQMVELGVNALYLGPVFESSAHGYDTANYYELDRRLGSRQTLASLSGALHRNGIRLVLDAVFNHVGRDFWAFRDVQQYGASSIYRDWFDGLRFDGRSPYGDPFTYQPWNGHYDLVRLNQRHPDVRAHLFDAVRMWINEFGIDGLRLDAADVLDPEFMRELRAVTQQAREDFWLVGEVVHGDYRNWVNPSMLDSVTNYEAYKGLYSSLVDRNYFEIAHTLRREFAEGGIYRDMPLYNFVDNHDVNRAASQFSRAGNLYPLYLLLLTMPGVPSVYYGSEWGLEGKRTQWSDSALRPFYDRELMARQGNQPNLRGDIARLARLRAGLPALRYGTYTELAVSSEQFAFAREWQGEYVVIALNSSSAAASMELKLPRAFGHAVDVLNSGEVFPISEGRLHLAEIPADWGRVLRLEAN